MVLCSINDWWNIELSLLQRIFFIIACATTLFMILQIILMLIGMGSDNAFDSDTSLDDTDVINDGGVSDMAGLRLVTVRTVLAFLCIGSWLSFTMLYFMNWYFAVLIGAAGGILAGVGVAFAMKAAMKLQESGNIEIQNAVGKICEVYLTIPEKRKGYGKVQLYVQESLIEREAVTDYEKPIKTGSQVKVIEAINDGLVLVEPVIIE